MMACPFIRTQEKIIKNFVENELCGKVDLYVSGHDHNLQTLPGKGACSGNVFVVSGAGASKVDKLPGKNKTYFQAATVGFSSLQFKKNKIIISHHNIDGNLLHEFDYKKK